MAESCDYQGYEFGAGSYPDSVCIEGRLFDADDCTGAGEFFEPLEDIPCPICHRAAAIRYWTERNRCGGSTLKDAARAARLLVTDIRQNRGLAR